MPPNVTPKTAADAKPDARHPDTKIDLDPELYGFTTIDTDGVVEAYTAGPGVVEPVRHDSVTGPDQTTMRDRAAKRVDSGKTQNTTVDTKTVDTK